MENHNHQEEWKTMDEYPGYTFSNRGRAYSYKSKQYIYGTENIYGYVQVHIKNYVNENIKACLSRIIYYLFGDNPELLPYRQVDHIDHERKDDNSIDNLRLATSEENQANRGKNKTYSGNITSSDYVGVNWNKSKNKWETRIFFGKRIHLGYYNNERNAAYVYNRVASCFKPPNHWLNTLPGDFELPEDEEKREYKIGKNISKINHYLNQ